QAQPEPGAPLQLANLHLAALAVDARSRELPLQEAQTELRLHNIETERLPSIAAQGQIQYQSDVPHAFFALPSGQPLFSPPKDTYDASLRVDQRVVDMTIRPRLALERAQLAESQARVRATIYPLRQEVNDAFFAAALQQQQASTIAATITDLEGRLRETNARVTEGTAVAADV